MVFSVLAYITLYRVFSCIRSHSTTLSSYIYHFISSFFCFDHLISSFILHISPYITDLFLHISHWITLLLAYITLDHFDHLFLRKSHYITLVLASISLYHCIDHLTLFSCINHIRSMFLHTSHYIIVFLAYITLYHPFSFIQHLVSPSSLHISH